MTEATASWVGASWADLGVPLADLAFDFGAADGYRPSSRDNCTDVMPLPGSALEAGYVNLETFDLVWDEAAGMPGCASVNGLALIEAPDP